MVTAFLTAIYMFRLIFMTFWGESRADAEVQHHIHESPPVMTMPLVILAIPSALLGLVVGLPPEGGWIHTFLEPVFFDVEHEAFAWLGDGRRAHGALARRRPGSACTSPTCCTCADTELPGRLAARLPAAYKARYNKMYMDEVYEVVPIRSTIAFAGWLWTFVDVKVIDGAVNGAGAPSGAASATRLRPLQTGRVQNYALSMFAGMLVLVVVLAWVWGA